MCECITAAGNGSSDVICLYFMRRINKSVLSLHFATTVRVLQFQGWTFNGPILRNTVSGSSQALRTASYHLLRCIRKAIFLTDEGCVLAKEQECITFNETSLVAPGLATSLSDGSKQLGPMQSWQWFCSPGFLFFFFLLAQFCSFKDVSRMLWNTTSTKGPPGRTH